MTAAGDTIKLFDIGAKYTRRDSVLLREMYEHIRHSFHDENPLEHAEKAMNKAYSEKFEAELRRDDKIIIEASEQMLHEFKVISAAMVTFLHRKLKDLDDDLEKNMEAKREKADTDPEIHEFQHLISNWRSLCMRFGEALQSVGRWKG